MKKRKKKKAVDAQKPSPKFLGVRGEESSRVRPNVRGLIDRQEDNFSASALRAQIYAALCMHSQWDASAPRDELSYHNCDPGWSQVTKCYHLTDSSSEES
jgi:hypothetical protein